MCDKNVAKMRLIQLLSSHTESHSLTNWNVYLK